MAAAAGAAIDTLDGILGGVELHVIVRRVGGGGPHLPHALHGLEPLGKDPDGLLGRLGAHHVKCRLLHF